MPLLDSRHTDYRVTLSGHQVQVISHLGNALAPAEYMRMASSMTALKCWWTAGR